VQGWAVGVDFNGDVYAGGLSYGTSITIGSTTWTNSAPSTYANSFVVKLGSRYGRRGSVLVRITIAITLLGPAFYVSKAPKAHQGLVSCPVWQRREHPVVDRHRKLGAQRDKRAARPHPYHHHHYHHR
jgi:hypothetical protein